MPLTNAQTKTWGLRRLERGEGGESKSRLMAAFVGQIRGWRPESGRKSAILPSDTDLNFFFIHKVRDQSGLII